MKPTLPFPRSARGLQLGWALIFTFAFFLVSCRKNPADAGHTPGEPNTPRTTVPAALVGRWHNGNLSSIGFFDAGSGTFGNPSGSGFFFNFTSAGNFEFGGLLQSSWYGCTTDFLSYKSGTMVVSGNTVTLYPRLALTRKTDSCNPANNYEKTAGLDPETFQYEIGSDEWGNIVLYRLWPDGSVTVYRREG